MASTKLLYPSANEIGKLSKPQLAIKIARHSNCSECDACSGLRPPPDVEVALDEPQPDTSLVELSQYGSEDEESMDDYLQECGCGHHVTAHGADEATLGRTEFLRRARVAIRMDEFLEDEDKLLDFGYSNETVDSLRNQMTTFEHRKSPDDSDMSSTEREILSPKSSSLSDMSDGEEPPPKRRRGLGPDDSSPLHDNILDDSDEEDRPLAQRVPASQPTAVAKVHTPPAPAPAPAAPTPTPAPVPPPQPARKKTRTPAASRGRPRKDVKQRSGGKNGAGKQLPSKKAKSSTAPITLAPPTEEEQVAMNNQVSGAGVTGHEPSKVKVEDTMDESQLNRLATGVTVDAAAKSATTPPTKAEKVAHVELRKGVIRIEPIENDGSPRSWIVLTQLKTLFQKQLPKMPREYIARLVYDSNSRCMAILKRGLKVVGGICFRPFPHRGFAEIVFFATNSVDQVKGYGGMLMDHFKAHIRRTYPDMMHFLTYADNFAVGYFKKQGFSKEITLPRSVWAGYIKDYEGGTIMQCTMLRKVDYLRTREIIGQQREAILEKIREKSRSHVVYPGLFQNGETGPLDPKDVPGLRESGWTADMVSTRGIAWSKSTEHNIMRKLLSDLQAHPVSWAYLQPVDLEVVTDYLDYVSTPMDFATIEGKLNTNAYPNLDALVADAQLVFDNAKTYNPPDSPFHKNAKQMEKYMRDWLVERVKKEES